MTTIAGGILSAYLSLGALLWGLNPPLRPTSVTSSVEVRPVEQIVIERPTDMSLELIRDAEAAQDQAIREDALATFLIDLDAFFRSIAPPPVIHKVSAGWVGCHAPMTHDPDEMRAIVIRAAEMVGVDPAQLVRIPGRESGWNPDTQNCTSGACGLFQHLPKYWPGRAEDAGMPGADCRDPMANALAGALLFKRSGYTPWASSGPY